LFFYYSKYPGVDAEDSEEAAADAAAVVEAAVEVAAVEVATDFTAHLGGTDDRLTVNWQWGLIGLL